MTHAWENLTVEQAWKKPNPAPSFLAICILPSFLLFSCLLSLLSCLFSPCCQCQDQPVVQQELCLSVAAACTFSLLLEDNNRKCDWLL